MKYLGPVSNEKDIVKKEYVDEQLENKLGKTETAAAAKKIDIQAISRSASVNLNNYVTDGVYSWAAGTTSMMNEPTGETGLGIMFVTVSKNNANYLTQEIHYLYNASAVRIYRRNKFNTTWTAWDRVLTANQGYIPDLAGTLKSIPLSEKSDLNNYTDQGFYVSGTNSAVANYTNCPTTSAFSMFVYWSYNNDATATQEIHVYSTNDPRMFIRTLYSGAWGAWKEISFKGDSVSAASEANKLSTAREIKVDLESSEAASFDGTQDITPGISGVLPVSNGGTGLSVSPSILINLSSTAAANVLTASPRPGIMGTLPISHGGTGAITAAAALTNLGLTATAAELNHLDGITATVTELNYTDGVTSNIQTQLNAKAALASPTFTGTPKAPTAAAGTNTTQIATTAYVKTEINNVLAAAGALIYKGTIGTDGTITALPASHTVGDTYVVSTAGNYAGETCEIGDMIICVTTRTTANNADWNIVQTNINGAVTGPASAVTNRVATFNGTTGKVIKDSGFTIASSVPANAKFTDTTYTLSSFGITATATELNRLDGITATTAELNYTDGVTSNIQTQLNSKAANTVMKGATSSVTGATGLVPAPAAGKQTSFLRGDGTWVIPTNTTYSNMKGATTSAAGKAGLAPAPSAGAANRYLRSDGTWAVPPDTNTTYTLSSFGITATAAELNHLDGITATATELNYTDGVTSNIQTQLNAKQATITGGASTITSSNLTANRALVSNASGKVAVSTVTSTELGYLDGVTSAVQTQLNNKLATTGNAVTATTLYTTVIPSNSDLNDYTDPGFYVATNSSVAATIDNSPTMLAFNLRVFPSYGSGSSANVIQRIQNYNSPDIWYRSVYQDAWTSWTKVVFADDTIANATSATKLTTARTIRTNLASTTAASFNGTVNIAPGVTGTLPVANGGTGATTAAGVLTNLGITATAAELNKLDGVTTTAAEFNYVHGVTSNIQTQINNVKPKLVTVTLSSSQWTQGSNGYTQAKTVSDVSATETAQMINIIPKVSNQAAYIQAGVSASAQAANSITFTALKKPTVNLTVYVVIEKI